MAVALELAMDELTSRHSLVCVLSRVDVFGAVLEFVLAPVSLYVRPVCVRNLSIPVSFVLLPQPLINRPVLVYEFPLSVPFPILASPVIQLPICVLYLQIRILLHHPWILRRSAELSFYDISILGQEHACPIKIVVFPLSHIGSSVLEQTSSALSCLLVLLELSSVEVSILVPEVSKSVLFPIRKLAIKVRS